jgi:DNA polymerase elongation subunit (family B)
MKLFEAGYKKGYDYYIRYNDGEVKTEQIDSNIEFYEPYSKGHFSYILDDSLKLQKKYGNYKDARDKYGVINPIERNIRDNYWLENYNKNPRIWYLDIETRVATNSTGFPVPDKALEPISMIQIFDSELNQVIMLGLRDWKHQDEYNLEYNVKYIKANDEVHLITLYLELFKKLNPLILYAWNGNAFDFPYIYNRMKNLGFDTNALSNFNETKLNYPREGQREYKLDSDGHFYIDLMVVYKNFTFNPRTSYALDNIAEVEIKEKKVQHTEYVSFDDFYTGKYVIPENPTDEQKNSKIYQEAIKGNFDEVKELAHSEFCYYSYKDPLLIKKIDDKLNFTALMIMISETMGIQLSDATGTIKPWSQYIQNTAYKNNKIMPKRQDNTESDHIVGGYVREPEIGKHDWILSADVNSMYPLLGMVGFNMSPETFVEIKDLKPELRELVLRYFNDQEEHKRFDIPVEHWTATTKLLQEENMSLGINGAVFKNDNIGMIPEMVQDIYGKRKQDKKTMFKYQQKAIQLREMAKTA